MVSQTMSLLEVMGSVLLFCLVFGMSATVDIDALKAQLNNRRAILTALLLQFVIMPFVGFSVVKLLQLNHPTGITLLVVTSSPGGSYSNWWCSMFNADLALSVTMTAISTILSTVMLPINLLVYARIAFNDDIVSDLDWSALILAIMVVMIAIGVGLYASASIKSSEFNLIANRLGNGAGILLIVFSAIMSSSDAEFRVWDRDFTFYGGVALPCLVGLLIANLITISVGITPPERVATSIECCYQNVGIATSLAISMFSNEQLAEAIAVPFYYGAVEAIVLLSYCIFAWKSGWTKAPKDDNFWHMLCTSYEVLNADHDEISIDPDNITSDSDYINIKNKQLGGGGGGDDSSDDYCYVQHDDYVAAATTTSAAAITAPKQQQQPQSGDLTVSTVSQNV